MTFTAIDFETATAFHPCSVGIVTVENGVIVDEFVSQFIKQSVFSLYNSSAWDLSKGYDECKIFSQVFPEIQNDYRMVVTMKVLIGTCYLNQWRCMA
jgi:DNA polymerase-3 subunit epsilon